MHTKMLEEATHAQLKSFLYEQFDELKKTMPELYEQMEEELYEHLYGPHFTAWKYDCAVSCLVNQDGTKGPHWPLQDIRSYAGTRGLKYEGFNEYDLAYTMNMLYSDYFGVVPDTVDSYYKMTLAFLQDKDAPVGKAYRYYLAMKH